MPLWQAFFAIASISQIHQLRAAVPISSSSFFSSRSSHSLASSTLAMDPRVRDLYKRFLLVGRDYPSGLSYVREATKAAFRRTEWSATTSEHDKHKAVTKGRYMVREMIALIQLKKYRTLSRAYPSQDAAAAASSDRADALAMEAKAEAAANADAGSKDSPP